jgi:hypothetical protein
MAEYPIVPNGSGSIVQLNGMNPHWQHVVAIAETKQIWASSASYQKDLYAMSDISLGASEIITKITVFANVEWEAVHFGIGGRAQIVIKSGSTESIGPEVALSTSGLAVTTQHDWPTDPATGRPWTQAGINALQVGAQLKLFIDVDYRTYLNWINAIVYTRSPGGCRAQLIGPLW